MKSRKMTRRTNQLHFCTNFKKFEVTIVRVLRQLLYICVTLCPHQIIFEFSVFRFVCTIFLFTVVVTKNSFYLHIQFGHGTIIQHQLLQCNEQIERVLFFYSLGHQCLSMALKCLGWPNILRWHKESRHTWQYTFFKFGSVNFY